jgi:hypothetical protein
LASKHKCNDATARIFRKVMILEGKIYIFDKLAYDESVASVVRHFHVNESSLRTIKWNKATIIASVERTVL